MQYIMTFIWSVLLISMLNYVVSAVLGAEFDFNTGLILSVVVSVLVLVVTAIIPSNPVEHTEHH